MRARGRRPNDSGDEVDGAGGWRSCISHLLDLTTTVESCKRLVTYLKQSELVNKLSKSAKQDVETRWKSVETMLSSVDEMWDEVILIIFFHSYCKFTVSVVHTTSLPSDVPD